MTHRLMLTIRMAENLKQLCQLWSWQETSTVSGDFENNLIEQYLHMYGRLKGLNKVFEGTGISNSRKSLRLQGVIGAIRSSGRP